MPSQLEDHVGFWLRFVSNHVSGRFQRLVEENGVTVSEWVALRALYDSGRASPAQLGDSLGLSKGAVSKVLDRLEARGLARRRDDARDRRALQIELTAAGRALVPRLAALADDNDAHFFAHLSPAARTALVETLKDVVRTHELRAVPVD